MRGGRARLRLRVRERVCERDRDHTSRSRQDHGEIACSVTAASCWASHLTLHRTPHTSHLAPRSRAQAQRLMDQHELADVDAFQVLLTGHAQVGHPLALTLTLILTLTLPQVSPYPNSNPSPHHNPNPHPHPHPNPNTRR